MEDFSWDRKTEPFSAVSHILTSISSVSFDTVRLYPPMYLRCIRGRAQEESDDSSPTDRLPLCRVVDAALATQDYKFLVAEIQHHYFGSIRLVDALANAYECNDALYHRLFPKLVAKGVFEKCDGECWIHRCVIKPILCQPLSSH